MTSDSSGPTRMDFSSGYTTGTAHCEKHGEFTVRMFNGKPMSICPACADESLSEGLGHVEAENRLLAESKLKEALGQAGIPRRFADKTLDTFVAEDTQQKAIILDSVRAYAKDFRLNHGLGRSLVFYGGTGNGKTHLACGVASAIIAQGFTAHFCTAIQAVRRVKETYSRESTVTEEAAIKALASPDLLILDEVGIQFGTVAENIILFEIINRRYLDVLPTIVISNLGEAEITGYLGERVMDRLRENGGKSIFFPWPSYRK